MVRLIITVAYYNMITHFITICALIQRKSLRRKQFVALTLHINICAMASKDGSMVRYASIFAKKYGTLVRYVFFVMIRVRYGYGTLVRYAFFVKVQVRYVGTLFELKTPDFSYIAPVFCTQRQKTVETDATCVN